MSSTSAALSKGARSPNHSSIATLGKPRRSSPAGFASPSTVDHSAERPILRREVARPAYSRAMREVVAKRIMEMAQRGVQDREALVADALRFVTANYEESGKLTD